MYGADVFIETSDFSTINNLFIVGRIAKKNANPLDSATVNYL